MAGALQLEGKVAAITGDGIVVIRGLARDALRAESAINRQVTVAEVVSMCLYLTSDASSGVTGQALSADGGVSPYLWPNRK
jgi:enoyl-[acyl-carrier-protein] reductase (NADH)